MERGNNNSCCARKEKRVANIVAMQMGKDGKSPTSEVYKTGFRENV